MSGSPGGRDPVSPVGMGVRTPGRQRACRGHWGFWLPCSISVRRLCSLGSWRTEGLPCDSEADHLSLTMYFINSRPPPTKQEPPSWPPPPRPPTPFQPPCSFDFSSSSKKPPLVVFFSPKSSARRPLISLALRFLFHLSFSSWSSLSPLPHLPPESPPRWRERKERRVTHNCPAPLHLLCWAACPAHTRRHQTTFLRGISEACSKVYTEKSLSKNRLKPETE